MSSSHKDSKSFKAISPIYKAVHHISNNPSLSPPDHWPTTHHNVYRERGCWDDLLCQEQRRQPITMLLLRGLQVSVLGPWSETVDPREQQIFGRRLQQQEEITCCQRAKHQRDEAKGQRTYQCKGKLVNLSDFRKPLSQPGRVAAGRLPDGSVIRNVCSSKRFLSGCCFTRF